MWVTPLCPVKPAQQTFWWNFIWCSMAVTLCLWLKYSYLCYTFIWLTNDRLTCPNIRHDIFTALLYCHSFNALSELYELFYLLIMRTNNSWYEGRLCFLWWLECCQKWHKNDIGNHCLKYFMHIWSSHPKKGMIRRYKEGMACLGHEFYPALS